MSNPRTTATILAALRFFQGARYHDTLVGSDEHFHDHSPLLSEEIDTLCEQINCSPATNTNAAAMLATLINLHEGINDGGDGITASDWQAARQALAAEITEPTWIPVTTRLPDADTCVIAVTDDDGMGEAYLDGETWFWSGLVNPIDRPVTHWQHLPELPDQTA